jgi:hypothetical protein
VSWLGAPHGNNGPVCGTQSGLFHVGAEYLHIRLGQQHQYLPVISGAQ